MGGDLNLHVGRERNQRDDCWHGWSYGVWTVARWRAGEVVQRDRLMLIEEEAREAAERGYSRSFKYPL